VKLLFTRFESSIKINEDDVNYTLHAFVLNMHNGEIRDLGNNPL
jgi:hypothetical protein